MITSFFSAEASYMKSLFVRRLRVIKATMRLFRGHRLIDVTD